MDRYIEYAVKKNITMQDRTPVVVAVLVMVVGFTIWGFKPGALGPTIMILGIVGVVMAINRQSKEYEYIFVNEDCEIARIVNATSRKNVYSFNGSEIKSIHPYTSMRYDNCKQAHRNMEILNYTSANEEQKEHWYAFINEGRNRPQAIILELNEKCEAYIKDVYKEKYQAD